MRASVTGSGLSRVSPARFQAVPITKALAIPWRASTATRRSQLRSASAATAATTTPVATKMMTMSLGVPIRRDCPARGPLTALAHLFDRASADHRFGLRAGWATAGVGLLVAALHEEPLPLSRPSKRPAAAQLHALQPEGGVPGVEGRAHRLLAQVLVGSAVPDDHWTGAVLALGNNALEVAPGQRVVVDLHRQALVARIGRGALRHGPRLERAVDLEPEVPVHAGGGVLLDHEARHVSRSAPSLARSRAAPRGGAPPGGGGGRSPSARAAAPRGGGG